MEANVNLKSLSAIESLAKTEAQKTGKDQSIYKTNEGFTFIQAEKFTGRAVRVIRYSAKNKHDVVLPDPGVEQSDVVGEKPEDVKAGTRKSGKRNLE